MAMHDPREDQYKAAEAETRQKAREMARDPRWRAHTRYVPTIDAAPESLRPMLAGVFESLDGHELGVCGHLAESPGVSFVPQWVPPQPMCEGCFTTALAEWLLSLQMQVRSGKPLGCNACGRPIFQACTVLAPVSVWLVVAITCDECAER